MRLDTCVWKLHKKLAVMLLLISVVTGSISIYIHLPSAPTPLGNFGLKYSDVVFGVFFPRFSANYAVSAKYWYNLEALKGLVEGRETCPVPYIDYLFEYPPVVGLLWYLTTCLSIKTVLRENVLAKAGLHFHRVAELHFILNSVIILCALISTALLLPALSSTARNSRLNVVTAALWLVLPSTVLYSVYNWDLICAVLALAGLVLFCEKKYFSSGALLGLSVTTKLMTASIAYALLLHLLLKMRRTARTGNAARFAVGLTVFGAAPYAALFTLSPRGFHDFIAHHSTWYCENCLYLPFIHDIFSPLHRLLAISSVAVLAVTIAHTVYMKRDVEDCLWLYKVSACSVLGAVLFNYVFSPQMVLLFSPLVMALYSEPSRVAYLVSDSMNFLIMFFFFYDYELRYLFSSVGIPVEARFSPWTIDSPIQWFATVRNMLLLLVLVVEFTKLRR